MTDFTYKASFKFNGLNHVAQLEQDKCLPTVEDKMKRQMELDLLAQQQKNQVFDPTHMDFNIRDVHVPGEISLDPNDMTFDFE